jgi:hypothetical protein
MKVPALRLADKYRTGTFDNDLEAADVLAPVSTNDVRMILGFELGSNIASAVLDGTVTECRSAHLSAMSNLTRSLRRLKEIFGMRSLSDYSFDLESMDAAVTEEATRLISTFAKDFIAVDPIIKDAEGYADLTAYKRFFTDLGGYLGRESSSARGFGIDTGIELERILKGYGTAGNLASMLKQAFEKGLMSEEDYQALEKFREFRNKCAHDILVPEISKKDRHIWSDAVRRLAPKEETK